MTKYFSSLLQPLIFLLTRRFFATIQIRPTRDRIIKQQYIYTTLKM